MNEITREQWAARLRDPNSRQAGGQLMSRDGAMCCLGHLADLIDSDGWQGKFWHDLGSNLSGKGPAWINIDQQLHATALNDIFGWSLPQIAD